MRSPAGQALTQAQQRMQRAGSVSTFRAFMSMLTAPVGHTLTHSPQRGQPSAVTGTDGTAGAVLAGPPSVEAPDALWEVSEAGRDGSLYGRLPLM